MKMMEDYKRVKHFPGKFCVWCSTCWTCDFGFKKTSGSGVAPGPYVDALNFGMVSGGGMTVSLVFPGKISAQSPSQL